MKTCSTCKHFKRDNPHFNDGECAAITGETEVHVSGQGLYPETGVLLTVTTFGCTLHEEVKIAEDPNYYRIKPRLVIEEDEDVQQ